MGFRKRRLKARRFFSTLPTPRTAQTGQHRALTVCKIQVKFLDATKIQSFISLSHLVVAGNGNVHVSQRRVSVAQGDGGDVDVGSLSQWLMISTRVRHNQQTGLPERCLDLIGECTRGETTMEGSGTSGRSKLQHCSLKWGKVCSVSWINSDKYFHTTHWSVARSQSNPSHRTAVLLAFAKRRPDFSSTLPTPEHRHQCPALTVCFYS